MVLKPDSESFDIFRISMTMPWILGVSDQLSQKIESQGKYGMRFFEAENYRS